MTSTSRATHPQIRHVQLLLLFALLGLISCRSEPTPTPTSETVFFPKYNLVDGKWVSMTGEIEGELVRVGDCLRLVSNLDGTSYLIVWPPPYELDEGGSALLIRDETGRTVARLGEEIYMGGGESRSLESNPGVTEQLISEIESSGCSGPYWIAGSIDPGGRE